MRRLVYVLVCCFFVFGTHGALAVAAEPVVLQRIESKDLDSFLVEEETGTLLLATSEGASFSLFNTKSTKVASFSLSGKHINTTGPLKDALADPLRSPGVNQLKDGGSGFALSKSGTIGVVGNPFFMYTYRATGSKEKGAFSLMPVATSVVAVGSRWAVSTLPLPGGMLGEDVPFPTSRLIVYDSDGDARLGVLDINEAGSPTIRARELILVSDGNRVRYAIERGSHRVYALTRDYEVAELMEDTRRQYQPPEDLEETIKHHKEEADKAYKQHVDTAGKELTGSAPSTITPEKPPAPRRATFLKIKPAVLAATWNKPLGKLAMVSTGKGGEQFLEHFDPTSKKLTRWQLQERGWKVGGMVACNTSYVFLLVGENGQQKIGKLDSWELENGEQAESFRVTEID